MQLPSSFIESIADTNGFQKEAFEKVHEEAHAVTSIRVNPLKPVSLFSDLKSEVSWSSLGYYLKERPSFTFDPLFHAGCYYVQEASSMFLEQALKQTVDLSLPIKVLDLCAAPGGKSTHIQSLISKESLLVSNEVIKGRAGVLKENIIKWGCENVMVTNNDPKDFSRLKNYFDVIVVDAPCSGSGLFRRDEDALAEWSTNAVMLCAQRQQRILADTWPALKKGGVLIYSTCSYSKEEDEAIVEWMKAQGDASPVALSVLPDWQIVESEGGYRFWPHRLQGEGFFLAAFRKKSGEENQAFKTKQQIAKATKQELEILRSWVQTGEKCFVKNQQTIYAWPASMKEDFNFLLQQCKVIYSGILVGEMMGQKLIPNHALAMSRRVASQIKQYELDLENAIAYLQRKEIKTDNPDKGWTLAGYSGQALGWMNVLPNRINNYYPNSLRILKDKLSS